MSASEWFANMVHAIRKDDLAKLREGFDAFKKYHKQFFKFKDTLGGHANSTLLHYALRKNVSKDMIKFLLEYLIDSSAISDGQTYYDIAIEKGNLFAAEHLSSSEERTRIQNEIVPVVASAIRENKATELEDLLKERKNMLLFTFPYGRFQNIFTYAIHTTTSPSIIALLIKYGQMYNVNIDKDTLYTNAYNMNASNSVLKLLEPANIINNAPLHGITLPNSSTADAFANRFLSKYAIRDVDGLKVLTLLKGTMFFNAFNIMKPEEIASNKFAAFHNANNMYLQLLNGILPLSTTISQTDTTIKIKSCIDRNAVKFFYTNPAGGPALGEVHGIFNTLAAFELKHDINVVVLMTPANQHRLEGREHDAIYNCKDLADEHGRKYCKCSFTHETCPYAAPYDVCIKPSFLKKHNIHGHIAIAEADSFNEKMQAFYDKFNENNNIPERYKKINNAIFKYCTSVDKRTVSSSSTYMKTHDLYGFPEIVLQLYGSQWYSEHVNGKQVQVYDQQFEIEIPIEDNNIPKTIVKYLLNVDTSKLFKNADNPLQLKYIATSRAFYNLTNGNIIQSPFMKHTIYGEIMKEYPTYFYLNYIKAYFNNEMDFFLDPRTGFFMNSKSDMTFLYNHNNEIERNVETYKRFKLQDYITKRYPNSSMTLFEKSGKLRNDWIQLISLNTLSYSHTFNPDKFSKYIDGFSTIFFNKPNTGTYTGTNNNTNINIAMTDTTGINASTSIASNGSNGTKPNNNLSNILGFGMHGGVITQKQSAHHKTIQKSRKQRKTQSAHHKTLRNIMRRSKLPTHVKESKFTTPLWIDQEYMKICQIIKAYL